MGVEQFKTVGQVDFVTSSSARTHSWELLLPQTKVRQVKPGFTEELMEQPLNVQPAEWPMEMAKQKAFQDISALFVIAATNELAGQNIIKEIGSATEGRHLRMYSDTISIAYAGDTSDETSVVLEKPRDLVSWFRDREKGAMALSGKNIEICTGLTAIDMKNPDAHPSTVLVRIAAKMRPYEMEDVNKIIENHGAQAILTTAGGISIWNGGTSLYDGSVPLRVFLQTDPYQQPVLIKEVHNWQSLSNDQIKQILYGAVPEAMDGLLHKLDAVSAQKKIIQSIPITIRQTKSVSSKAIRHSP